MLSTASAQVLEHDIRNYKRGCGQQQTATTPLLTALFINPTHYGVPDLPRPSGVRYHGRMVELNPLEARVLGSLIEKEITTPEYYPLSLNALVNACNQKSSRDPVMELTERDARGALASLEDRNLVRVLADARVPKFEHRVRDGLGEPNLRRDDVAVLCLLLLRGPQTPAELRMRTDRLYAFDDNTAVLATLERLAGRAEPLTRVMARQPGAREPRWRQLLTGAEAEEPASAAPGTGTRELGDGGSASLAERVRLLEDRLERLEARLEAAGLG